MDALRRFQQNSTRFGYSCRRINSLQLQIPICRLWKAFGGKEKRKKWEGSFRRRSLSVILIETVFYSPFLTSGFSAFFIVFSYLSRTFSSPLPKSFRIIYASFSRRNFPIAEISFKFMWWNLGSGRCSTINWRARWSRNNLTAFLVLTSLKLSK